MPAFYREVELLNLLKDEGLCHKGFPLIVSSIDKQTSGEILMEALGPDL